MTGYIICATTVPDYFTERNWRMSELTSLIYGANVLLFGGLGLVVAFSRIENFSEKQERSYPLNNERQLEKRKRCVKI